MNQSTLNKKRQEHQLALADSLQRVRAALAERPDVKRAILFGSYQEGRRDLFTDLDILIVVESDLDFLSRTARMYQYLPTSVDMDLLVYTSEELERIRDRPFVRRILEQGEIIYEKQPS
ncbi:MAG: nucleotidyltransferase domain-containing protein [Chloroflexota bacterium]|nr:nucleotidyltransferase domain-containing protein [Chloroflexota bacterium]